MPYIKDEDGNWLLFPQGIPEIKPPGRRATKEEHEKLGIPYVEVPDPDFVVGDALHSIHFRIWSEYDSTHIPKKETFDEIFRRQGTATPADAYLVMVPFYEGIGSEAAPLLEVLEDQFKDSDEPMADIIALNHLISGVTKIIARLMQQIEEVRNKKPPDLRDFDDDP